MVGPVCRCAALAVLCTTALSAQSVSREQAVALALEHNPQVIAGRAEWQAARADARILSAPSRPELELEYEGLPGVFDLGSYGERTIGVTQRLGFPLKWWNRIAAARHGAEHVRFASYETSRRDVLLAVQIAYDTALADRHRLDLAASHVELSGRVLRQTRLRFEAGDVGRLEVARGEVATSRLQNRLSTARFAADRSLARLNVLMGNTPASALSLTDSLECRPVAFDLDALSVSALVKRTDFAAAGHGLNAAKSARGAARASVFPDIAIGVARQTPGGAGSTSTWRTGISLELPLYAFADPAGGLARASAKVTIAEAEREAIRLRVLEEVRTAFFGFEAVRERLARIEDSVLPAARVAMNAARRGYEEGKASSLEYLAAQGDFIDAELELLEARLEYRNAESMLRHAAGYYPLDAAGGPAIDHPNEQKGE